MGFLRLRDFLKNQERTELNVQVVAFRQVRHAIEVSVAVGKRLFPVELKIVKRSYCRG